MVGDMSPAVQKAISLAAGLAALVFLVYADIAGMVLHATAAGLVGTLAGGAVMYLVPAPGHSEKVVEALREGAKAIAASREPSESPSNAELVK